MHRRLACLVAFSFAVGSPALHAVAAPCERAAAAKAGTWFETKPPFPGRINRDLHTVDATETVAVDPGNPDVVLVSDGVAVLRSTDGGCTWRIVFELPLVPGLVPDQLHGQITSIDVAREGGRTRTLLAIRDDDFDLFATRSVIVRSDDGQRDWVPVFDSLLAGVPAAQVWAPVVHSAGNVAYAAFPSGQLGSAFARSTDGGRTWTVRTPLAERTERTELFGFAVNPWQPDELWSWHHGTLWRSTDGAATWTAVDAYPTYDANPYWQWADVMWPRRGGPARILILGENSHPQNPYAVLPVGTWSGDGGRTFRAFLPPVPIELDRAFVAHLPNGDVVVLADNRRAWRIPHRGRAPRGSEWRPLDRAPLPGCAIALAPCNAAASASLPGVVAMPTGASLLLLQVAR